MSAFSAHNLFDLYPQSFAATTTIYQAEEMRSVAELVSGNVVDLGCGSAKLAAYLQDKTTLKSYVGVDASAAMLLEARHLLINLNDARFNVVHQPIEDCSLTDRDWVVCLNALYAVADPQLALRKMHCMLKPGAGLVITTPNEHLNMEKLLKECQKDLILHPLFHTFRDINRLLARTYGDNFVSLDTLSSWVSAAGFNVTHRHAQFFAGGLNFLVARRNR